MTIQKKRRTPAQRASICYKQRAVHGIGPTQTSIARQADAKERAIIRRVRELCDIRDGYCRVYSRFSAAMSDACGPCEGRSEWAHFGPFRRSNTRGMDPEVRHTTAGSLKICSAHHQAYDRHELVIEALSPDGCDGPLAFKRRVR